MIHSSTTPDCPSASEWREAMLGRTSNTRWMEIESHLMGCPRCEATVDSLTERSDTVVRNLCQGPANAADEDGFQRVYEALLANPLAGQLPEASSAPELPMRLGQYELQTTLGQGANGSVFRALHVPLNRVVAVKLLRPDHDFDPSLVDRFAHEMRALGALDHQHVVRATDAGEADGQHYLAMEFVPGIDLSSALNTVDRLSIPDACEILRQTALGLAYLHEHGFVHRDVKPSNLLLTAAGQIKLLDLGLVQSVQTATTDTKPSMPHGTADYMSPEQWQAFENVSPASDLYSLGCTLAKLLTKSPPYRPLPVGYSTKFAAHCNAPIPDLRQIRSDIPDFVQRLFQRLVAKDAQDRFASAGELAEHLVPLTRGANLCKLAAACGHTSDVAPQLRSAKRWTRRQWLGWTAGTAGVALLSATALRQSLAKSRSAGNSSVVQRDVWRDLQPAEPVMLLASSNQAAIRWETTDEGLRIVDQDLTLLHLGQPMTSHFRLAVGLRMPLARPYVGWIFNYHRESEGETTIHRFRALELVRSDGERQARLRWRGVRLRELNGDFRQESFPWAETMVSETNESMARLEVALGPRNVPQVRWCGKRIRDWKFTADGQERSNMPPSDQAPGSIGLVVAAATAEGDREMEFVKPCLMYDENAT